MSIYSELIRLGTLFQAAQSNPYSCPRDRNILWTKIQGLEKAAEWSKNLNIRAAKAIEIAEAEQERLRHNLAALEVTRAISKSLTPIRVPDYGADLEVVDIRLWELDMLGVTYDEP